MWPSKHLCVGTAVLKVKTRWNYISRRLLDMWQDKQGDSSRKPAWPLLLPRTHPVRVQLANHRTTKLAGTRTPGPPLKKALFRCVPKMGIDNLKAVEEWFAHFNILKRGTPLCSELCVTRELLWTLRSARVFELVCTRRHI